MSAQTLGKRKYAHTKPFLPLHYKDKCPFCRRNLPKHARAREAHVNICHKNLRPSSAVSEEEGAVSSSEHECDQVFLDDDVSFPENEQNEQLEDIDTWLEALAERGTLSTQHMLKFME